MISKLDELLSTTLQAVTVSPDLARKIARETKNAKVTKLLTENKKLILTRSTLDAIAQHYSETRPVGRPRITTSLEGLTGEELLRAKNRLWKRNSRQRQKERETNAS